MNRPRRAGATRDVVDDCTGSSTMGLIGNALCTMENGPLSPIHNAYYCYLFLEVFKEK